MSQVICIYVTDVYNNCIYQSLIGVVMRKHYCSPDAESICVETFIIAASTDVARSALRKDDDGSNEELSSWGSIWD